MFFWKGVLLSCICLSEGRREGRIEPHGKALRGCPGCSGHGKFPSSYSSRTRSSCSPKSGAGQAFPRQEQLQSSEQSVHGQEQGSPGELSFWEYPLGTPTGGAAGAGDHPLPTLKGPESQIPALGGGCIHLWGILGQFWCWADL